MRLARGEAGLLALLLVGYGWLFVFFERINNPNELVRVYAARALAEDRSFSIGRRLRAPLGFRDVGRLRAEWGVVGDTALVCDDARDDPPGCTGTLYAAKAPGSSLLGAPLLGALRAALGRAPTKTESVLALRWAFGIVPSVLFWLLFRNFLLAHAVPPDAAFACTLAAALGSLSLTYGPMFAGHQHAALALGGAYLAAFWPGSRAHPALIGFLAALAVCLEYPSAPAALLVAAGWIAHRRPTARQVLLALLGALPPALAVAWFHVSAFGAPWSTPYGHLENPEFVRDISHGFLGISPPTWERIVGSLFLPEVGLVFWAPWIALTLAVAPALRRNTAGLTALAVVGYEVLFQITHALWRGGWVLGPRYITPIVPFAAAAIALGMRSMPEGALRFFCGAAAASIAATGLASSVAQWFPLDVHNPLREVVAPLLAHGYVPRNPLQLAGVPGLWSALPYFAALALAIVWLLRRGRLVAVATAAALCAAQWLARSSPDRSAARYFVSIWEPNPPPGAHPF